MDDDITIKLANKSIIAWLISKLLTKKIKEITVSENAKIVLDSIEVKTIPNGMAVFHITGGGTIPIDAIPQLLKS